MGEKKADSTNGTGETRHLPMEELDQTFSTLYKTQLNSRIQGLHLKHETLELLQENIGNTLKTMGQARIS